jgi:hypothetical protein
VIESVSRYEAAVSLGLDPGALYQAVVAGGPLGGGMNDVETIVLSAQGTASDGSMFTIQFIFHLNETGTDVILRERASLRETSKRSPTPARLSRFRQKATSLIRTPQSKRQPISSAITSSLRLRSRAASACSPLL